MINVGLAGFGSSGRGIHAPLRQQAGMTVAAVSTSDPQRAEQVSREVPGAQVVTDLDALLDVAGLDLIVLATPSGLHARQGRQCIDAGNAGVPRPRTAGAKTPRRPAAASCSICTAT